MRSPHWETASTLPTLTAIEERSPDAKKKVFDGTDLNEKMSAGLKLAGFHTAKQETWRRRYDHGPRKPIILNGLTQCIRGRHKRCR